MVIVLLLLLLFDVFVPQVHTPLLFLHKRFAQVFLKCQFQEFCIKDQDLASPSLLLCYTIWIEHHDKAFNQKQWHESKVKNMVGTTS